MNIDHVLNLEIILVYMHFNIEKIIALLSNNFKIFKEIINMQITLSQRIPTTTISSNTHFF